MKRVLLVFCGICGVALVTLIYALPLSNSMVVFEIENTGDAVLKELFVEGAGLKYNIGSLKPGQTIKARLRPLQEGSLSILFTGPDGTEQKAAIAPYLGATNFGGRIEAKLNVRGVESVTSTVTTRVFPWLSR